MAPLHYDLLVVGAGAAGMPAAIFASLLGARVLVADSADRIGGTFHYSTGQMSAAGTRLQALRGIHDTPDLHYQDVMRISRNTADPALTRLAVDHAADTLHWLLDQGLHVLPDHPIIHFGHAPYSIPRTYWAQEEGRAVLAAMLTQYQAAEAAGSIDTWLDTVLESLLQDKSGAVCGASFQRKGGTTTVTAGAVILATGGFAASPALFEQLSSYPLHGGGNPANKGGGLGAALAAGACVAHRDKFLPTFAAVASPGALGGVTLQTQTNPRYRRPWELYVNSKGHRFLAEDELDLDVRERALRDLDQMAFWVVYDETIRRAAPALFVKPGPDDVMARFGTLPGYVCADDLAALARGTGMEEAALHHSVAIYNACLDADQPDPMGRTYRPVTLLHPPFYAVRHVGWSVVSWAGLAVDGRLRVTREDRATIPGLYAAGEILGLGATSGDAFVGGMSVTPAMTFGRLLGLRLGAAKR
jgi:fumarate reductase flavoprotein subunit